MAIGSGPFQAYQIQDSLFALIKTLCKISLSPERIWIAVQTNLIMGLVENACKHRRIECIIQ
jgi:hypothetical protein